MVTHRAVALVCVWGVAACGSAGPARAIVQTAAMESVPVAFGPRLAIGEQRCAELSHVPQRGYSLESGVREQENLFGSSHEEVATRGSSFENRAPRGDAPAVTGVEVEVDTNYTGGSTNANAAFRANIRLSGVVVSVNAARAAVQCGQQAPFTTPEVTR